MKFPFVQGGPLLVINGVISYAPINGVITLFITGRGPTGLRNSQFEAL